MAGDYLEPFVAPAPPSKSTESAPGSLDFSSLGRVLFGDEQRWLAEPSDFLIVARAGASLTPGTRVAVYRDLQTTGVPLTAVGEGVIVSTAGGPVMRVTTTRDAVSRGDYVVPHK